ncbi:hypothetical protein [Pseudonocardia sp. H11422]|uniref:hypothetical protein n=1 Tax=Pseudonocardia sp. H11422 TaxID=2835866 RepID=UPI001BDD6EB4|nr:hypothetical protein [Pseudonocardia sp. H11422]
MTARSRRAAVGLALLGALLAGCGRGEGGGADPASPASPAPATPAAPTSAPVPDDPDAAACRRHAGTVETVRRTAGTISAGPMLPAGVALVLLAPRDAYAGPQARDAALTAAMTEVVDAIDDLDAQGRDRLPPGANPAQDKVQLDATRIVAALDAVDRACPGPG